MVESLVPRPPPRHTGDDKADIVANNEWTHSFYVDALAYFQSVESAYASVTFDPSNLIDPASATISTAQETANTAYLLADQAYTEALAAQDGLPLFGSDTISDPGTSFTHVFAEAQPDTTYYVVCSPSGFTGAPAAGSQSVVSVTKSTTQFTVTVAAAPGAGATVTFDWMVGRNGD